MFGLGFEGRFWSNEWKDIDKKIIRIIKEKFIGDRAQRETLKTKA